MATRRQSDGSKRRISAITANMLRDVIDGQHLRRGGGKAFGVTRTAVERRVKALALRLCREVGVEGLNPGVERHSSGACATGAKRFFGRSKASSPTAPPRSRRNGS